MSTIVKNFADLDLTKQYAYSDYLLCQFSERVELINGFVKKLVQLLIEIINQFLEEL